MELQARTQETKGHCAKGREGGSKASRTPKLPYQWTWELGRGEEAVDGIHAVF